MDADRDLKPHRRQHWAVEPDPEPDVQPVRIDRPTADETRADAKRILWRDSAILLIGVVVALLVVQFLPQVTGGLVADETAAATGRPPGASPAPGSLPAPNGTLGPIVDPSLAVDATARPSRPATLPPTGTFEPGETPRPTPRPTRKPPATPRPTPERTAPPTPEITPEITPVPAPTVSISCSVEATTVTCDATTTDVVPGSQRWDTGGDGALVSGGDGTSSIAWSYLDPGTYQVTLTIDGADGSQAGDSLEVTV